MVNPHKKRKEELKMFKFKAKDFLAIPNILSYFRIVLVFVFLFVYQQDMQQKSLYLGIILIASGISDALDGYIARKYNMITELGKCLDPIADKLTQFVLLICLLTKYPMARVTLGVFIVKEVTVTIIGYKVICQQGKNDGAKWYGKLSTIIFYVVAVILVLFADLNVRYANILLGISSIAILGAFIGYTSQYAVILLKSRNNK